MRLMHIGYSEATSTPMAVIQRQIAFDDIEHQIEQMKANQNA